MPLLYTFASSEKLIYRLKKMAAKREQVCFLLGAGICMPQNGGMGVAGAEAIISEIGARFSDDEGRILFDKEMHTGVVENRYQTAMRLLAECEGQDALNDVIKKAVFGSLRAAGEERDPKILEEKPEAWFIPPALAALPAIIEAAPTFGNIILTSNFDPLIEMALRQHAIQFATLMIADDGNISSYYAPNTCKVVHFHGYWHGSDTLHTAEQLSRERPKLKSELRKIINGNTVVVLGYSGWRDVFLESLVAVIDEGEGNVLWTFFESDHAAICVRYQALMQRLCRGVGGRVVLFSGIDAHVVMPQLARELCVSRQGAAIAPAMERPQDAQWPPRAATEDKIGCDLPPAPAHWVGRNSELNALGNDSNKVAYLNGIGGQGKSCLAARFVEIASGRYDFWDWRDCREEANRMQTILLTIVRRLSGGAITSEELSDESIDALIDLMFSHLGMRRVLFVFDNVDHYLDLKRLVPTGPLDKLVDAALGRRHNAKFIFTCRPTIQDVRAGVFRVTIAGLSEDEARQLFIRYGIRADASTIYKLSSRAWRDTNGHPLWLSVIAAHAASGLPSADFLLSAIAGAGAGDLGKSAQLLADTMLAASWSQLNPKERVILRALAEAVRPESQETMAKVLVGEIHYSALRQGLNRLRSLNLIMLKEDDQGIEFFELHPLVREFLRARFPRNERESFIVRFVRYFAGVIVELKGRSSRGLSFVDLQNWSCRCELEVNRGDPKAALEALADGDDYMLNGGYFEEYIRIAELVVSRVNWGDAVREDYAHFAASWDSMVHTLTDLGRYSEAEQYLKRYEDVVGEYSRSFVRLCDARTYCLWHQERFADALEWGQRGTQLKRDSGGDIGIKVEHNWALALRDTRENDNITKALEIFLGGARVEDVVEGSAGVDGRDMAFFGNVGRCLQFVRRFEDAMICYRKALEAAAQKGDWMTEKNRGYAYRWIGEVCEELGRVLDAAYLYRYAEGIWLRSSPPRALAVRQLFANIAAREGGMEAVKRASHPEVRVYCERIVRGS